MPELPEVETVKSVLEKRFVNKTISDIEIRYPKIIDNIEPEKFKEKLIGQTILSFSRKGKYLIFNLSHGHLISHLRMEGKYKFDMINEDKHCHIIFKFTDGDILIYHDVRKFGKMEYYDNDIDIYSVIPLLHVGLEPWEIKSPYYLYDKFNKSKKVIKEELLDQSIIAGIGNIYADEICFACHILPTRPAKDVTLQECEEIIKQSDRILKAAIKDGGSTVKTYQSAHGVDGRFQTHLMVYGRENEPCRDCGNLILKTRVGGRGTHYCAFCQK